MKRRGKSEDLEEEFQDEEEEHEEVKHPDLPKKKARSAGSSESIFELGAKRKVAVSLFKGNVLVNIREFYEDRATGELKPGSKGIALTVAQWQELKRQVHFKEPWYFSPNCCSKVGDIDSAIESMT